MAPESADLNMTEHSDKHEPDERDESRKQPKGDESIELEPVAPKSSEEEPDTASPRAGDAEQPTARTGVPLEERQACPNCNAIMPDDDALVCVRCGYDMKLLHVQRTKIERPVDDDDEEDSQADEADVETPICRSGRGELWGPAVVGGLSAALLMAGYLAGAPGLYPELRAADDIGFMDRILGLVRFIILSAVLTGCGLSGVWMLTMALRRPLGDLTLAAVRIGAIVLVMRLMTLMNFGEYRQLEFLLESVLQAGVFVGLTVVAFAIKPRTALMLGGFSLITFLAVWIGARLVVLATW